MQYSRQALGSKKIVVCFFIFVSSNLLFHDPTEQVDINTEYSQEGSWRNDWIHKLMRVIEAILIFYGYTREKDNSLESQAWEVSCESN